jgi:alcohol dehydrogenase class IV
MAMTTPTFWVQLPYTLIGTGAVGQIGKLAAKLGGKKVLVVTDKGVIKAGLLDKLKRPLEEANIEFGVFDGCEPNCPVKTIQNLAEVIKSGGYDLLVGLGGGSTLDTTKLASIASVEKTITLESVRSLIDNPCLKKGLPKILISTTAGTGSETSPVAVTVDLDGVKKAIRHENNLADIAIVDPLMTQYLPKEITADTGIDALSHAFEAFLCPQPNVLADGLAEMCIRLISDNLRLAYYNGPQNLEARYNMALAATYAMATPIMSGFTSFHSMGHCIQIEANITHGASLYLMMPPVMDFKLMTAPHRFARIAELMGEKVEGLPLREAAMKAIAAVRQLGTDLGMPQRLRDVGIRREQIPGFVDTLFGRYEARSKADTRAISREDALKIYESIW